MTRIWTRTRRVTGERVTTDEGGFNPTYQRHVAAYAGIASMLPAGRTLDLGCGTGHSAAFLAGSVGLDIDHGSLAGQPRPTVVADMRRLPFRLATFDAVVSVQSLEHVPDPFDVVHAVRQVLAPGGVAVFVTPNRLTFGAPDEVIDPYHYVEYDPHELEVLCHRAFDDVTVVGLFGSPRYQELVDEEHARLRTLLRFDRLRLRRAVPRRLRQTLYDRMLARRRSETDGRAEAIARSDFHVADTDLERSLDVIAVCRAPAGQGSR